jgi:drug/metabolite transporter (DMT)-like permease
MPIQPILFVALGVTLFGVIDGLAKLLAGDYSVVQIVWARYAFAVPVILAAARPTEWPTLLASGRPWLQGTRSVLPLVASLAAVVGLLLIPLAEFTAISFAAPLLVVALSAPLLKERITIHSWIGVVLGFAGVLVIVRPGAGAIAWAAIFPLTLAFFFAVYQLMTRIVSRHDQPLVTLAWTIAAGLVLTTPALLFNWHPVATTDWVLLILSGLLFGMAHLLLTKAYAVAPASVLAPFIYIQILAAIVFGIMVFEDVPDGWTLAGTALIVLAGVYVLRQQPENKASAPQP